MTFRLADALSSEFMRTLDPETESSTRRARIESLLDTGSGDCLLRSPEFARIVQDALFHFDDERYQIIAWRVMPNHVHVLIRPVDGFSIGAVAHSWKSFSAKTVNSRQNRSGRVWQADYYYRFMRNDDHIQATIAYIEGNPVKAGLAPDATQCEWSSASRRGG